MLPDETFAPCMPTAYVWVRVRLCFHPRPLGAPPFLRAVRRAYMEPSRWRLKVSPTWKGGGQPRWTFRQGVPPLRAGRMRTPPAYQPRSLPPIIAHQLRSSLISLGHMCTKSQRHLRMRMSPKDFCKAWFRIRQGFRLRQGYAETGRRDRWCAMLGVNERG